MDADFRGFPRRVRQTRAVDAVGKRSQADVSRSDGDNSYCVTGLVSELTSLSLGELTIRRVGISAS